MIKQEPESYSFDDLVKEGRTDWTGVRNYQARNNLRDMKRGDKLLFYHSGSGKEVVGTAMVSKANFPDPTDEKWIAVEVKPGKKFKRAVSLAQIRSNLALANMGLLRQSQLSVIKLTQDEYEEILSMSK